MNAAHYKILLRELSTRKDGKHAIYLYCLINGTKKYYSLKCFVDPLNFDLVTQRVTKKDSDHITINIKIEQYITKAKDLVNVADAHKTKVSLVELDELLRSGQYNRESFTEFIKNDIELYRNTFEYNTIRKYESSLAVLKGYKKNVFFYEIDAGFWRKYELYLKGRGNNQNTIHKSFTLLKVFLKRALALKVIKENPFEEIKVKKGESRLRYLTIEELDTLAALYKTDISAVHKRALQSFLFSCYTGLRYSDIKALRYKNIVNGSHLVTTMKKVKKTVTIPLNDFALELLPAVEKPLPELKVFRVYSRDPMTRYLKEIAEKANINKRITFHYSRHTFGTCSIEKGIDVYTIRELMGHSSVNTTQIYAKVTSTLKDREMEKWNKKKPELVQQVQDIDQKPIMKIS